MNRLRYIFVILAVVVTASCDPVYPPFIRNDLGSQIGVRVDYNDGTFSQGVLRPKERLVFGPKGKDIRHLRITSGNKTLYDLDAQALATLRNSIDNGPRITWSIGADGIEPVRSHRGKK